jgi:hypothetical protein
MRLDQLVKIVRLVGYSDQVRELIAAMVVDDAGSEIIVRYNQ